jgi:intracellular multiplication protein IcmO
MTKYIESRHELKLERQLVDIRPPSEQIAEWLSKPLHLAIATIPAALFAVLFPILAPILFIAIGVCVFAHLINRPALPFRYPKGEIDPKSKKEGDGILFFGNVDSQSPYEEFKEVWLSDDDLRKHMVILGSTGSGKSETLKSIFFNALAWSSGFFIADGKADNKLPVDVYSMVRANGRDQDLLILNFLMAGMTPEQIRLSRKRRSNSLNPFSSADPDTIIQMGANLLPKVEGDAKNWQEKALNLWRALVTALCYLRDTKGRDLSISDFIEYLALPKVEELYIDGYMEAEKNNGEWSYGFIGIKNYLESGGCPGYQTQKLLKKHNLMPEDGDDLRGGAFAGGRKPGGKGNDQDPHAYEQHAYRTSQLMPALNLLDKSYGYIFKRKYPEIDMSDVALRNRVLVMLIPSLEKSAQEAESLGKLTIACLRVMMSKNLGSEVEGSYQRLILDKTTESPYPYVAALDELAYYFSDGIAVMFAQARSLGMCMIAAAQDLEKLTEGSRSAEAGAMIANTASKYFMRNDDQNKTPEMVQKIVGKATVAVKRSYEKGAVGYGRQAEVEIREEERITLRQMQAFKAGQGIFNQGGASRVIKSFFMGKDLEKNRPKNFHINRFLQVAPVTEQEIFANSKSISDLHDPYNRGLDVISRLRQLEPVQWSFPGNSVIAAIAEASETINPHLPAHERAIALYLAARAAVQRARIPDPEPAGSTPDSDRTVVKPPLPAHLQDPETASMDAIDDGDGLSSGDDNEDVLAFLKPIPFQRKPADEILRDEEPAPPPASATQPTSDQEAAAVAAMNPLDALLSGGKTLNMGNPDHGLHAILKPGDRSSDPVAPEEDWIQEGLENAAKMLESPRSSDNTVVGLTQGTLEKIERAEEALGSPDPAKAAKALERVVSVRVTPETQATKEIDPDDIDAFFQTLQESVSNGSG